MKPTRKGFVDLLELTRSDPIWSHPIELDKASAVYIIHTERMALQDLTSNLQKRYAESIASILRESTARKYCQPERSSRRS
jgi:hypothetical protein